MASRYADRDAQTATWADRLSSDISSDECSRRRSQIQLYRYVHHYLFSNGVDVPAPGATLDIYGFSNTSYQIIIDPSLPEPYTANITTSTGLASSADSESRHALFSSTSLSSNAQLNYAQHEVLIRNVGAKEGLGVLGLDYVVVGGIPVGAEG